jgi:hypothetical protein
MQVDESLAKVGLSAGDAAPVGVPGPELKDLETVAPS